MLGSVDYALKHLARKPELVVVLATANAGSSRRPSIPI